MTTITPERTDPCNTCGYRNSCISERKGTGAPCPFHWPLDPLTGRPVDVNKYTVSDHT